MDNKTKNLKKLLENREITESGAVEKLCRWGYRDESILAFFDAIDRLCPYIPEHRPFGRPRKIRPLQVQPAAQPPAREMPRGALILPLP